MPPAVSIKAVFSALADPQGDGIAVGIERDTEFRPEQRIVGAAAP